MRQGHDVLVVDDDRDLRAALVMMLEAEGHTVVEAGHGHEALSAMIASPPHLIILDLVMPVMDGRTFLEHKARSEHAKIPVVIFSSSPPEGIERLPDVVSVVHKLSGVDALVGAIKHAAHRLAEAFDAKAPRVTTPAFRKLEKQLLGLGIVEPIIDAVCSACSLPAPLVKDTKPPLCLACLAAARGFDLG